MADTIIYDPETGRSFRVMGRSHISPGERKLIVRAMRREEGDPPLGMEPGLTRKDVTGGIHKAWNTVVGAARLPMAVASARLGDIAEGKRGLPESNRRIGEIARDALSGESADLPTPSSEYHRVTNTPPSPWKDLAADSILDPMNALLPWGRGAVIDIPMQMAEELPRAWREARLLYGLAEFYQHIATTQLPMMNVPQTGRAIVKQLEHAGYAAQTASTGLKSWLLSHGSKLVSRAMILARMLADKEFRSVIDHPSVPLARTATVATDYNERVRRAHPESGEESGPLLRWLLRGAAAVGGVRAVTSSPGAAAKVGSTGELGSGVNALVGEDEETTAPPEGPESPVPESRQLNERLHRVNERDARQQWDGPHPAERAWKRDLRMQWKKR